MKKVELILKISYAILSGIVAITVNNVAYSIVWLISSILTSVLVGYCLADMIESEDTE